jgi:hypothetical protein
VPLTGVLYPIFCVFVPRLLVVRALILLILTVAEPFFFIGTVYSSYGVGN